MDNVVNLKRKAQKLVQKGSYDEAIKTYGTIAESGHMDPYDFVVLGDLLLRTDRKDDAIDRYQEALDSYVQGGLHRNAIALCKRIKRLVPEKLPVLRQLADLYAAEGLNTEASLHYIEYLEKAKDQPEFGEAAEEICVRLLGFPLPTFDLVPRIVAIAEGVDRGPAVAPGVLFQAQRAAEAGREKLASDFHELANGLDPQAAAAAGPEAQPGSAPMMDPGAVTLDEDPEEEAPQVLSLDDDLPEAAPAAPASPPASSPATPVADAAEETLSLGEIDLSPMEDEAPVEMAEPVDSMPTPVGEGSALRERADRSLAKGESVLAQREYLRAAQAFLAEEDDSQAEEVYLLVVRLDPNHIDALEGLVDIADRSGDATKVARYGCDLGDVLLARDRYEEALGRFRHVIASDPENAKAQSRIKRLESMMGGGESEEPSRRGAGVVEVRDEAAAPTQTSLDLSAILDEFRASIVDSIPENDAQSHYDMGMAYREMGLLDEALIEYQTASANESLRWSALEMMAECYLQLGRPQDTLQILEELLAGVSDPVICSRIHLAVGKAREALGHADEAEASYCHALELNGDLAEATERLNAMDQRRAGGMD